MKLNQQRVILTGAVAHASKPDCTDAAILGCPANIADAEQGPDCKCRLNVRIDRFRLFQRLFSEQVRTVRLFTGIAAGIGR